MPIKQGFYVEPTPIISAPEQDNGTPITTGVMAGLEARERNKKPGAHARGASEPAWQSYRAGERKATRGSKSYSKSEIKRGYRKV